MNIIIKFFRKINQKGETLFGVSEEIIDDEAGTVTAAKQQIMFHCPACGQPLEQRQVRENCILCGTCCDWCHEERLKLEKSIFERMVIIEKERLRWLESKVFDNIPGVKIFRHIEGFKSIKKLEREHRKLLRE
jgi:ferredoxin